MTKDTTKKKNVVTTTTTNEMSMAAVLLDAEKKTGFESVKPEDVAIPFIRIAQSNSPQLLDSDNFPGLAIGDFFNSVSNEIYGKKTCLIPCAFQKVYNEWVPRTSGGGFVKQHLNSSILDKTTRDEKGHYVLENGNHIVQTAMHYCCILKDNGLTERVVLSLTSTQLKKSRKWLSYMMTRKEPIGPNGQGVTPPMFAVEYEATSVPERNEYGSWFGITFGSSNIVKLQSTYEEARAFNNAVTTGEIKVEEPNMDLAVDAVDTTKAADSF